MRKLDKSLAFWMIVRGTTSYYTKRPIGISFEVTHSCNCNCLHCDWGGMKPREKQMTADVVDFQVTQSLVDFIDIQTQRGPHFRLQE